MRQFRIGMTDIERLQHTPGTGVEPGKHLNLTVSLADVWEITLGSRWPASSGYRKPKFAGFDRTERQIRKWAK